MNESPELLGRLEALFEAATSRPGAERAAFIREACGADAALRDRLERLVAAHEQEEGILDRGIPGLGGDPPADETRAEGAAPLAGETIGDFRILRSIASGGMGSVYEAAQGHPQRPVALKILKRSVLSDTALRRFELEGQILGSLQHPGIAQIYEAGVHRDRAGELPYLAMELVRGQPLTVHAEAKALGTSAKVELLIRICEAVAHAHRRGVVHRDLKPGNILVDESGQPKVLDFGVARATDSDIQTTTLGTDVGQLVGTIAYMSPEQAAGDPRQVDARSDVYALGVILYELLTRRLPHDVRGKLIPEAVRAIREDDPTPLSSIDRIFRGDLETIVQKALEKDRDRRYGSAHELAADLERYLRDEPILARPASTLYQLAKFARRNRVLVGGTVAVLAVLVIGIAATSWQALRARRSEAAALELAASEARQKQVAIEAQKKAEEERERAASMNKLFLRLFAAINPFEGVGESARVVDLLDDWEQEMALALSDRPAIEVPLRNALAGAYMSLGLLDKAEKSTDRAAALAGAHLDEDDPAARETVLNRALIHYARGQFSDAEPLLRRALEVSLRLRGGESEESFTCRAHLARTLAQEGKAPESAEQVGVALEYAGANLGADDPAVMRAKDKLADVLVEHGELAVGERLYRENLEAWARHGAADGLHAANTKVQIAYLLLRRKQVAEAEKLARESLETARRKLGADHRGTFRALRCLAMALGGQGKVAEAEQLLRHELDLLQAAPETFPLEWVRCWKFLGQLLSDRGKHAEAAAAFERAQREAASQLGEDHRETLSVRHFLATALMNADRRAEARAIYEEVLPRQDRLLGAAHPDTIEMRNNYGVLLQKLGDLPGAEAVFLRLLALRGPAPEANVETFRLVHNLAFVIQAQGRPAAAEPHWRQAVAIAMKIFSRGNGNLGVTEGRLAGCLIALERHGEAEQVLLKAFTEGKAALGAEHVQVRQAASQLVELYRRWGRPAEAAKYEASSPSPGASSTPAPGTE